MKRAYIADTLVDAQLVADLLLGNSIACEIFHQNSAGAIGELPVTSPEVWVRRDPDLALAQKLIAQIERCQSLEQIQCPHCHEDNPADFDICWQCQHPLNPV